MNYTKIKNLWSNNKPVLNGWLMLESSITAEIMSRQGYDSLTIDMQHGLIGYSDVLKILQSIKESKVSSIVRVPWLDPGVIMKSLDAGANAIICPMINNRKEADDAVEVMKEYGLKVNDLSPEQLSEWNMLVESMYPLIRGNIVQEEIFDRVIKLKNSMPSAKNKNK